MKRLKEIFSNLPYSKLLFSIAIFSFTFVACNNDDENNGEDDKFANATVLRTIEVESSTTEEITIDSENFIIERVINNTKNGDVDIFGDAYSLGGQLIAENRTLHLEGLGKLTAVWNDRGFEIIRDTPHTLKLIIFENYRKDDFNFSIILKVNDDYKKIVVKQNISKGYEFKAIDYSIEEGDTDSLYFVEGTRYIYEITEPKEIIINPYHGVDTDTKTYFVSDVSDAFFWYGEKEIEVRLPNIYNNTVSLGTERRFYNQFVDARANESSSTDKFEILTGKSEFYYEIEFRKRQISYTITLQSNYDFSFRTIEGKFIEIAPTRKTTLIWGK